MKWKNFDMGNINDRLDAIQERIEDLSENMDKKETEDFSVLLQEVADIINALLLVHADAHGKQIEADDLLVTFKAFVKGDPSLNAVRDNVREIVYYQNCLAENREDALPKNPARMAVRTVQHICFYLRSRLEQDQLLD